MFEQVNIIYGEMGNQLAVMMRCYEKNNTVLAKKMIENSLAQNRIEKKFQLKSKKNAEKFAISSFKVNNSQQIEQFSDLIIKPKGVHKVYICRKSINRRNIGQKGGRFSCLNVAQELVG
ncbi:MULTISPECIES: hypothetical protein [Proteus]|jgi:hypothetical protein|nr:MULTISPECIES: hypothetical protein [Proteus]NBN58446.1 hypothetical protein [Proteus sp. G2639]RNT31949.1 hypothetical protein B9475_001260 [Proteus mirabilis]AYY81628.1 hypothetical protein EGX81_12405 [Proteus vulgaris]KGA58443.1 hypothetical protein DR95_2900 [Proteus vulgaris]MBG5971216.1 hypothetical protein [Proteus vulgaris]